MTLKECYAAMGGNYDDVLGRLRSDRLVQKFVLKFLDDKNYEVLSNSLESGNVEEAFRAAHTIKGMCQNLSFTTLEHSSGEITEALRAGNLADAKELFERVKEDYKCTENAIKAFQAEL